jgi:aminopeptidase N
VVEPNDLFASFDKVLYENNYNIGNGLTVNEFMSNWTLQSGYPVLQITKNDTSNTLSVIQVICTVCLKLYYYIRYTELIVL